MNGERLLPHAFKMEIEQPSNEDRAILVEYLPGDDKRIAFEGPFYAVLERIKVIAAKDRRAYLIELPDQKSPPFGYGWVHFNELIAKADES